MITEKSRLEEQWGKKERKSMGGPAASSTTTATTAESHGSHGTSNHGNNHHGNTKISERLQPIGASAENSDEEVRTGQLLLCMPLYTTSNPLLVVVSVSSRFIVS